MSETLRLFERGERIDRPLWVVAAHPGDEVHGAASLLLRCRRAHVIHVTDGIEFDQDRASAAAWRSRRARAALANAGLGGTRLHELGCWGLRAAESAGRTARRLAALLERLAPEIVVTHALERDHPDRDATCLAVQIAVELADCGSAPELIEMTSPPRAAGRRAGAFLPGTDDQAVRRLTRREQEAKRRMLECLRGGVAELEGRIELERFRTAAAYEPRHVDGDARYAGFEADPGRFVELARRARTLRGARKIGASGFPVGESR